MQTPEQNGHQGSTASDLGFRAAAESGARWLEVITESVGDGLVTMRADGTIAAFNAAAERMYGYDRNEIVGRNVIELVPEDKRDSYLDLLEEAGNSAHLGLPRAAEARHKDGYSFPIDLAVTQTEFGNETFYIGRVTDETERRQAEAALRASDELHRSVIASLDEGVLVIAADGTIEEANDAASRILRLPLSQIVGRNMADLTSITEFEFVNRQLKHLETQDRPLIRTLAAGESVTGAVIGLLRLDEETTWLSTNTYPIGALVDGRPQRAVMSFEDITERLAVDRMKDEFVSVVSHELRTPLTSIRGALGLLASGTMGTVDEGAQAMLDIAVSNADRLIRLINEILDIERMQSNQVVMERDVVSLDAVIDEVLTAMAPLSDEAGVSLNRGTVDGEVWADSDRVLQTVTNLISNAIKFSPTGGLVNVWTEPSDEAVAVHVSDQGRGIPEGKLEQIFRRFQQVDARDSREKGGTGLGLAICKEIVGQHGGRIWVDSELGTGSTFSFELPSPTPAQRSPDDSVAADTKPRVLLVEDDGDLPDLTAHSASASHFPSQN